MKLYDIYQLFVQASPPILILLIVVLSLIEITPIKVNPLRAIGRALAKGITSETNDKIDKMSKSFVSIFFHIDISHKKNTRTLREILIWPIMNKFANKDPFYKL